jgi:ATP-dependent Lhr-like helicase
LPILSILARRRDAGELSTGVAVLCVSPLRALIDDQHDRLDEMAEHAGFDVFRWHGDVTSAERRTLMRDPSGVVIITPESLEAMFVTRSEDITRLFTNLSFVVIDEMHALLENPRGAQVQSLLARLEAATAARPVRVGLSATLGDLQTAAEFLDPREPDAVVSIVDESPQSVQIQVRGYYTDDDVYPTRMLDDVYRVTRGSDNLVFANSREAVETLTDALTSRSRAAGVPNAYMAHHGSLERTLRDAAESSVRGHTPTTVVCTSTLELGVDIGSVAAVLQIDAPPTVAALRQRMGRSGRRDAPAVLRLYASTPPVDEYSDPIAALHVPVIHAIAVTELLASRWIESPQISRRNLSTLVQQILSHITFASGSTIMALQRILCGPGPFSAVDGQTLLDIIQSMETHELVEQDPTGVWHLGARGEIAVGSYSFFAAFEVPHTWSLVSPAGLLGTIPLASTTGVSTVVFAGRRWSITDIDTSRRVLHVVPTTTASALSFVGAGSMVGTHVRATMRDVLTSTTIPAWLDTVGAEQLSRARVKFTEFSLDTTCWVPSGSGGMLLTWVGDMHTACVASVLSQSGCITQQSGMVLHCADSTREQVEDALNAVLRAPRLGAADIASGLNAAPTGKWDHVLPSSVLLVEQSELYVDVDKIYATLSRLAESIAAPQAAPPLP